MNRWTRLGIEAYRLGNRAQAQQFFRYVLMEMPGDVKTWLWMVEVSDTDAERLRYLEQALTLDPENQAARRTWLLVFGVLLGLLVFAGMVVLVIYPF